MRLPQIPANCLPTKYACVSSRSHQDVVMLFCPSFTQTERFLHTDQLITKLQVVVLSYFIRMLSGNVTVNVLKSGAVICWAAIFRSLSSMFDKLLHLSKSQGSAMSRLRCHDLREAISNVLTVSMQLQDSLSRFHRPGLHKVDLRVNVASASARGSHPCVSPIPELLNCLCTAQSSHAINCTFCSIGLSLRFPRKLHQSARIHQNSDKPCSASWRTHTRDTTCFHQKP